MSASLEIEDANSNLSSQTQSQHPAATKYECRKLHALLDAQLLDRIAKLHESIFSASGNDELIEKIHRNASITNINELLTIIALDGEQVIGYKIGYPLMGDQHTFYSWLGGVDATYRQQGIASMLMDAQHEYLRQAGYRKVQTKTMNRWRNMLLLNIQYGFDIVHTFTDARGLFKIVLEKELV